MSEQEYREIESKLAAEYGVDIREHAVEGPILDRYATALIIERGDVENAIVAINQALAIAQHVNDSTLQVTVLSTMAGIHWLALQSQDALKYSLRAIELDRTIDSVHSDAGRHFWAALALVDLGDLESASTHAAIFLATEEQHGSHHHTAQALYTNQTIAQLKGDWESARDFSDRGLAVDEWEARLLSNRAMLAAPRSCMRSARNFVVGRRRETSKTH